MNAYLFDVDGVLTNPQNRLINKPELISFLVAKLQQGVPLGFISGRGMLWLRSSIVKVLENYLSDHPGFEPKILDNVFVSGEFGGAVCIHENGLRKESINHALTVPDEVKRGLHLVAFEFSEYIYIETEKQTIFTVVAKPTVTKEEFQLHRDEMMRAFQEVVAPFKDIEVQTDTIAINIRNKNANKRSVTDKYLQWLKEKGITPEKYFVFGDSPSDLEMGEELHKQQVSFEFVYVGEQENVKSLHTAFAVTFTKGNFDEGTLEFLKSHSV